MDSRADARREVGLEIARLAEEFERSDEAAFRRTRIAGWVATAARSMVTSVPVHNPETPICVPSSTILRLLTKLHGVRMAVSLKVPG
jgi:hypothetical protein